MGETHHFGPHVQCRCLPGDQTPILCVEAAPLAPEIQYIRSGACPGPYGTWMLVIIRAIIKGALVVHINHRRRRIVGKLWENPITK